MSKNKSLAIQLDSKDITKHLDMTLDKNDVITYKVAKKEAELEATQEILEKELDIARVAALKLEKKVVAETDAIVKKAYALKLKQISASLSTISDFRGINLHSGTLEYKEESKIPIVTATALVKTDSYNSHNITLAAVKPSAKLLSVLAEVDTNRMQVRDLIKSVAKVKMQLSQIDKLERQAKANMIENILSKSAATKQLLVK